MKTSHTLSEILFILSLASLSVLAVATTPLSAELIGQWSGYNRGPAFSVAVSGDLAYVAVGASLQVIDILDSASPQQIGSIDFEDTVAKVVVSGGHAYVATGTSSVLGSGVSLEILDISQPSEPKRLGRYETENGLARSLVVSGDHAFLVIDDSDLGNGRLQIIDISDPEQPIALGSYVANAQQGVTSKRSLAVLGDFVFWGIGWIGLEVIDISSPSEPVRVGGYSGVGSGRYTVAGSGNYILLGAGAATLELLDVSNPSQPQKVGETQISADFCSEIVISNSLAFVVKDLGFVQFELSVIDISEPTNLAVIGRYETWGWDGGVAVSGGHAYLATTYALEVIDISDPANPEVTGRYRSSGAAKRVIVSGDYAILASSLTGLQAIDVSEPSAPRSVGVGGLETFNPWSWNSFQTVAVSDNLVFVKRGNQIEVFDISDPLKMTSVATYWSPDTNDITVVGDYAYLSGGSNIQESRGWLEVIDIRDLNNLQRIGRLETSTVFTGGLAVLDNFAYIVGWRGRLLVIDVSDPRHPELAGRYEDEDAKAAVSLAVSGNYVYMGQSNGLAIIDVSNPARPERVGFYPINSAGRVILSGQHVYFAAGSAGLHVVDVSHPTSPIGVAFYDSPGQASDVWIAGNHVYLADGNSGLAILELFQKPRFEITGRNPFRLSISGAWNTSVRIQRSSNLLDWEDWQSLILGDEPLELSDATANEMGTQFYRVVSP